MPRKRIKGFARIIPQPAEKSPRRSKETINKGRGNKTMTVKDLMETLKGLNQDAEVLVGLDLKNRTGETVPASNVHPLMDEKDFVYIGFSQILNKKPSKKKMKRVIIY
jgi:hypothetical protein